MAEPQLVDYIKKAKEAGQSDEQTRSLLGKNGWTSAEISEAFSALQPQAQPQIQQQKPQIQTQQKPQYQPSSMQGMPKPHKSHALLNIVIVLFILIVIGGAGAYFALPYLNLNFDFLSIAPKADPATVLANMTTAMKNVKLFHTSAQLSAVAPEGNISANIVGDNDITDPQTPKANYAISFNSTGFGAENPVSGALNITAIGSVVYFKINSVQVPDQFAKGLNSPQVSGKWIKSGSENQITQKIYSMLSVENMLTINKQLGEEVVGGKNTYHFFVATSKEKIKNLFMEFAEQNPSPILSESMLIPFLDESLGAMGDINMDIWIGKDDNLLYKISFDKTYSQDKKQIQIKIILNNSNFGAPVAITAPADAQDLANVLTPINPEQQQLNTNLAQINITAKAIFSANNSYLTLCTRGLLNGYEKTYGTQLVNIAKDIMAQGAKNPACFSDAENYCVSSQLTDGTYLCTNQNKTMGTTKCVLPTTVCK